MKTLYSILGLAADATTAQIETAYAEALAALGQGGGQDDRIRLVAIKEAYSVLSDPIKRQVYNQKLFAPETVSGRALASGAMEADAAEPFGLKKILVVGALVIGGLALYSQNARDRERLRIEHEHEVQMKAVQVMERQQQQAAAEQEARLERQQQLDAQTRERQEKAELDRFNREVETNRVQRERADQQRLQREKQEQRMADQAAESKKRQEAAEAMQRLARDKAELQRLERERYGRVISY